MISVHNKDFFDIVTKYIDKLDCIKLEIPLEPISTPRPRFAVRGKFAQAYNVGSYTDKKKELDKYLLATNLPKKKYVAIGFIMEFAYPKSTAKKNLIDLELKHTKPDWDNLPKAFQDCLTDKYIDGDDSIISIGSLIKRYTLGEPKMICYLWYVE